jgi:surfeit locus 1 family protein
LLFEQNNRISNKMSKLNSAFYVFPAITFGLGTWQVYRWNWKQEQLAFREERRLAPVVEWKDDLDPREMEFKRVVVRGHYDHALEVQSGPRSFDGHSGFFVLTPLELVNGKRVLVNRGWVPRESETFFRPSGEVELTGVVRLSEKQTRFVPDNERKRFYWLDQAALNKECKGDFDLRLDAVRSPNRSEEPPIGGQTVYWMPNNHVTYIAT